MSARYEFIDVEKATRDAQGMPKYRIVRMCEWLEVSTSGFYEWLSRPMSATAARRDYLMLLIEKAFADSDETYGYRRVHAQLLRWGVACTAELVRALMRFLGLVACQPRPWRHSLTEQGSVGADPGPARAGLQRRRAGHEDGRRYYLHSDLGGLVVLGDGVGLSYQGRGGVGDG